MPNCLMESSLVDRNKIFNATRMNPPIDGDMFSPFLCSMPGGDLEEGFEVSDILNKHIKRKVEQNCN